MSPAKHAQVGVGYSVRTITFPGNTDGEVEKAVIGEAEDCIQERKRRCLLLDFFNVESLSVADVNKLAMLAKIMRATGGRLTLFNLSEHIYELLVVAGLETALGICREAPKVSQKYRQGAAGPAVLALPRDRSDERGNHTLERP